MKMTAFRDVPCCLVEVDRRFRGAYDGGAVRTPQTSVNFCKTTQRKIQEDKSS
jgi:hypothetical protein